MSTATERSEQAHAASLADLAATLADCGFACRIEGDARTIVSGLAYDSRRVEPGDLFLALPGTKTDGARFETDAVARGAAAIATHGSIGATGAARLIVDDMQRAAGYLAARLYAHPADALRLVGVTGTNGKTSCTYILEAILDAGGEPCGVLGTVSERWPGHQQAAAMTTPPAAAIQHSLARMVAAGCRWAALEVSSHALSQHRVSGCFFDAAIFTNLTRDHLDYHGDEETYFAAKARLFLEHLRPDVGVAVLNADDRFAMRLTHAAPRERLRTYTIEAGGVADVTVIEAETGLEGIRAVLGTPAGPVRVATRLVGRPNLANVAAVVAAAQALGIANPTIEQGLCTCAPVPGRLERVGDDHPVVLVDYAHTPDALARTLEAVRAFAPGRVVAVFGCGGDRDRGKRPMMGRIGAELADVVVLTSDNPRSEDPVAILEDIESGIDGAMTRSEIAALVSPNGRGYLVEADRERAIAAAISVAGPRDVVVVAGKGHEDYQEIAGARRHFDDREVVRRLQVTR